MLTFQYQQGAIKKFCTTHNVSMTVSNNGALQDLYHHLLVDDERKLLFCYVPKVNQFETVSVHSRCVYDCKTNICTIIIMRM